MRAANRHDSQHAVSDTCALTIAERIGDSTLPIQTETSLALVHDYRCEYQRVVDLVTTHLTTWPAGPG